MTKNDVLSTCPNATDDRGLSGLIASVISLLVSIITWLQNLACSKCSLLRSSSNARELAAALTQLSQLTTPDEIMSKPNEYDASSQKSRCSKCCERFKPKTAECICATIQTDQSDIRAELMVVPDVRSIDSSSRCAKCCEQFADQDKQVDFVQITVHPPSDSVQQVTQTPAVQTKDYGTDPCGGFCAEKAAQNVPQVRTYSSQSQGVLCECESTQVSKTRLKDGGNQARTPEGEKQVQAEPLQILTVIRRDASSKEDCECETETGGKVRTEQEIRELAEVYHTFVGNDDDYDEEGYDAGEETEEECNQYYQPCRRVPSPSPRPAYRISSTMRSSPYSRREEVSARQNYRQYEPPAFKCGYTCPTDPTSPVRGHHLQMPVARTPYPYQNSPSSKYYAQYGSQQQTMASPTMYSYSPQYLSTAPSQNQANGTRRANFARSYASPYPERKSPMRENNFRGYNPPSPRPRSPTNENVPERPLSRSSPRECSPQCITPRPSPLRDCVTQCPGFKPTPVRDFDPRPAPVRDFEAQCPTIVVTPPEGEASHSPSRLPSPTGYARKEKGNCFPDCPSLKLVEAEPDKECIPECPSYMSKETSLLKLPPVKDCLPECPGSSTNQPKQNECKEECPGNPINQQTECIPACPGSITPATQRVRKPGKSPKVRKKFNKTKPICNPQCQFSSSRKQQIAFMPRGAIPIDPRSGFVQRFEVIKPSRKAPDPIPESYYEKSGERKRRKKK